MKGHVLREPVHARFKSGPSEAVLLEVRPHHGSWGGGSTDWRGHRGTSGVSDNHSCSSSGCWFIL